MGMFDDHPFKTDVGSVQNQIRCPRCRGLEYDGHQNQWETFFECRKCGNRWSGGSANVARQDATDPPPPAGIPAPDDDTPVVQYTGAGFRDPDRNY